MLFRPEKGSFKKDQKIEIFQTSMVFVKKKELFIICVLGANQSRKDRFLIEKSKNSKFSKGVSPWFLSKNGTFCHLCFLGKSIQKRAFLDILDNKECFVDKKKEVLQKSKNSIFSKGSMVFVKKSNFYHLCFLGESSQKRSFFDILDKKECFPDQKNEVLKKFKK